MSKEQAVEGCEQCEAVGSRCAECMTDERRRELARAAAEDGETYQERERWIERNLPPLLGGSAKP